MFAQPKHEYLGLAACLSADQIWGEGLGLVIMFAISFCATSSAETTLCTFCNQWKLKSIIVNDSSIYTFYLF